ncbi:extracellular solute-binding protein [Microlunatus soli]|uniref:extracellular solute-binding protein n=1 Tax=Microlunatus soli TaxID=630515 RepID=UPI0012F75600|nr:extracellular solute-binding protein [Microlunatus soli]
MKQNEYWQAFNKRVGVDYQPTLVPADAYETKLATMLSGGSVPDMVFLHTDSANAQRAIKDGAFAELSSVLGGDKIKKYPNIAAVPTYQWEVSAVNNGIYGVPVDLAYVNALHVYRRDWARSIGLENGPQNADEFYTLMTEMSKLRQDQYGFGGYSDGVAAYLNAAFRVPNNWSNTGGKLINAIETDEFEAALEYTRRLWKGGAFHPDALSLGSKGAEDRALFDSGVTGWQVASADNWYLAGALNAVRVKNKGAEPELLMPFGHDGGKFAYPASPGFYAVVAISASAAENEDRLDEILRIFNYLRAPIPSEEGFFLRYGIEGVHFTYGKNRVPVSIPDSPAPADRDAMFYTGLVPGVLYYPDPSDVKASIDYTEAVTKQSVKDPTVGLYAASSADSSAKLDQLRADYVNGIVSGRRPAGDLRKLRADWKMQGGDKVRSELQTALEKVR